MEIHELGKERRDYMPGKIAGTITFSDMKMHQRAHEAFFNPTRSNIVKLLRTFPGGPSIAIKDRDGKIVIYCHKQHRRRIKTSTLQWMMPAFIPMRVQYVGHEKLKRLVVELGTES
jgi:hypothetical protein